MINNKRGGGEMLTEFIIEHRNDVRIYKSDSFCLTYTEGDKLPAFSTLDSKPINFIEYILLRDYIRELEGEESVTAIWMDRNEKFIFQS